MSKDLENFIEESDQIISSDIDDDEFFNIGVNYDLDDEDYYKYTPIIEDELDEHDEDEEDYEEDDEPKDKVEDKKTISNILDNLKKNKEKKEKQKVSIKSADEDNDEEETQETTSVVKKDSKTADWGVKLINSGDNDLIIEEFGKQKYVYKHIKDPLGNNTGYFSCHCNNNNQKDDKGNLIWYTKNQCLSKHYIVARVEELINNLKNKITIKDEKLYHSPFTVSWVGKTNHKLKLFNNKYEQAIFDILMFEDSEKEYSNLSNQIDMSVLNSYDGRSSIRLNYSVKMAIKDSDGKKSDFVDYFTLSLRSNKVSHKGNLDEIKSSLSSIDENLENDINILKSYSPKKFEDDVKTIASKLKEGKKAEFLSEYEKIKNKKNYNNLFYVLLLLSKHLNDSYSSHQHLILIPVVDKIIKNASINYEKQMNKKEKNEE